MGLTIHYKLDAPNVDSMAAAERMVRGLQAGAATFGFKDCSRVLKWKAGKDDPAVGHLRAYLVPYQRDGEDRYLEVPPLEMVFFVVSQPGSETALFGLGKYAKIGTDVHDGTEREAGLGPGWHWSAFCKTQYASLSQHGGWENFFAIHDGICRVLDYAASIGFDTWVHDEGEYWTNRDAPALRDEINRWNNMIAAFTGKLKDNLAEKGISDVVAPITEDPEYERMEARGEEFFEAPPDQTSL